MYEGFKLHYLHCALVLKSVKPDDDDVDDDDTGICDVYPVIIRPVGLMRNTWNEQNFRVEYAWKTEGIQMIILISILGDQNLRVCSECSSIRMVCGSGFCIN